MLQMSHTVGGACQQRPSVPRVPPLRGRRVHASAASARRHGGDGVSSSGSGVERFNPPSQQQYQHHGQHPPAAAGINYWVHHHHHGSGGGDSGGAWPGTAAASAASQQQQQQQSVTKAEESEYLWAGYSDLSEQLERAHAHNRALRARVEALSEAVARLGAQHEAHAAALARSPRAAAAAAWHAASFLLLFLAVINIAGALVSLHLAATSLSAPWLGWFGLKPAAAALAGGGAAGGVPTARLLLSAAAAAVPAANAAVVVVLCVQAVKAAWRCLRY